MGKDKKVSGNGTGESGYYEVMEVGDLLGDLSFRSSAKGQL